MDPNIQLTSTEHSSAVASQYRRLIGQLLSLNTPTPNVTYAVYMLTQFVSNLHGIHLHAAHQILHYLKASSGQGHILSASSAMALKTFSDADWFLAPADSPPDFFDLLDDSFI